MSLQPANTFYVQFNFDVFFLSFFPSFPPDLIFWTVVPPFSLSKSERVWVGDVYACEDDIEGIV